MNRRWAVTAVTEPAQCASDPIDRPSGVCGSAHLPVTAPCPGRYRAVARQLVGHWSVAAR